MPHPANWPFRVVRIRTTHDADGRQYTIAAGMGATPEEALAELRRDANIRAQQAANEAAAGGERPMVHLEEPAPATGRPAYAVDPPVVVTEYPAVLNFEVIDVRLTPTAMEGGDSGWLAYGTLAQDGKSPPAS